MKRLFVVIFTMVALATLADAQAQEPKKQAKGKAQTTRRAATNAAPRSGGHKQGAAVRNTNPNFRPVHSNVGPSGNYNRAHLNSNVGVSRDYNRTNLNRTQTNVARQTNQTGFNRTNVGVNNRTNLNRTRTNVARQTNQTRFNRNNVGVNTGGQRRFAYTGGNYRSFTQARQWNWHERHDRGWWRSQGFPIVLYGGGYYFWNNGWWYPAYGYDPYYSNYVYDGPIYGYGNVAPGDVTSQVQQALAQQGYYQGPIDGILGPMTRDAIQRFQADNGLEVTAAIDQSTLASLGLA
jgi:hypothetical protein